jgi:DNA polymerase-3 subunit alpha
MPAEFVHLHVHSQYSMLDSSIRIQSLVERVKALGMPAVALTDHANMFGALQLYKACKAAGIKPILGSEVNVVVGRRDDASIKHHQHLVLLARSQTGYRNLVRVVSRGWVEGLVHGAPRVDFDLLAEHREGLVALTGCMGGYLAQEVLLRGPRAGEEALARLRDTFEPDALFVELQDHGFHEQKPLNGILVDLARRHGLPVVATNDCHYLEQKDAHAQMVLGAIASGRTIEEAERTFHGSDLIYVRTPGEMEALFGHVDGAVSNTLRIAEMCGGQADPTGKPTLPRFPVPDGTTEEEYFRELARTGLERRFDEFARVGKRVDEEAYRRRLAWECDVVTQMGFSGYFLIVADFINWAKAQGIPVGPGRGSGAGSLAAYALRITDLDPIPYGLLFERFLNPERVSMPDFDVDFCMDKRDRVIEYVARKYGATSVGQIATFHLLKSRSVVRDVGRAMKMTPQEAGRIASLIPEPVQGKTVSVKDALAQEPRLAAAYAESPKIKELLDTSMTLEELTRHAGMHAAGVVISEGPLWDSVPVFCPEPGTFVTQYSKDDVEAAGLVKFDFLGLKTLTVIDIAVRLINKRPDRRDRPLEIDRIPLDDKATYALLQSGETTNVFQLESAGMQALFTRLRPDCFEDVIAAVALYRPGPLGSGMVEDFVQRKHGRKKVDYPHPCLEPVLKPTYGVIVYQEQVMQAAQVMAGYTLGGADLLRRAMGKKKPEEMAKQKATFVQGAVAKGYAAEDAEKVFELIDYFAGYGFNKSHSAAYALITYQTAYLKAHYPVEFVCATLSADKDKIDKVVRTVNEARSMGITVLPPDVNQSDIDFTVVYGVEPAAGDCAGSGATGGGGVDSGSAASGGKAKAARRKADQPVALGGVVRDPLSPAIRFGLGGLKGVGSAALEAIFDARRGDRGVEMPFADLFDFASRVDVRRVNKNVVEALVQSGAFDGLHRPLGVSRAQAFGAIEAALERGKRMSAERASGQTSLLGLLSGGNAPTAESAARKPRSADFPTVEPWDVRETLSREKQTLGFYVSGHPLDRYAAELKRFCTATTETLQNLPDGARVTVGGSVEGLRERPTKTGDRIAFFDLEDASGRVEVIVRPKVLAQPGVREILTAGEPVLVTGVVQVDRNGDGGPPGGGGEDAEAPEQASEAKLVLEEVMGLGEALRAKTRAVRVRVAVERCDRGKIEQLRATLARFPGPAPVSLELWSEERWSVTLPSTGLSVEPSDALLAQLERLFGEKVAELR